ncbi:hypothetical protein CCC_02083 [Paramagnetospirillum magnetotacticum MS-1]|uniref:Uncharacterized protein n=1 Tax=Paramagnetospirillum magnetotacticum MS-1 TaxID=272627 RepID=A0A0C2YU49_PARME|nr:hypothetical protein [Paramagnetospirillum magnetotacticum]KIL98633.1 hypothetical protein CCC_02083 [Paramagnetospirillum magnetotacticum MS-1]
MSRHLTKSSFLVNDWTIVLLLLPVIVIMGLGFWLAIRSHFG